LGWNWLEDLFCSEYKSKIDKLERKNEKLRKRVEKTGGQERGIERREGKDRSTG